MTAKLVVVDTEKAERLVRVIGKLMNEKGIKPDLESAVAHVLLAVWVLRSGMTKEGFVRLCSEAWDLDALPPVGEVQ